MIKTPGKDWIPGKVANHKSIIAFQRELSDKNSGEKKELFTPYFF